MSTNRNSWKKSTNIIRSTTFPFDETCGSYRKSGHNYNLRDLKSFDRPTSFRYDERKNKQERKLPVRPSSFHYESRRNPGNKKCLEDINFTKLTSVKNKFLDWKPLRESVVRNETPVRSQQSRREKSYESRNNSGNYFDSWEDRAGESRRLYAQDHNSNFIETKDECRSFIDRLLSETDSERNNRLRKMENPDLDFHRNLESIKEKSGYYDKDYGPYGFEKSFRMLNRKSLDSSFLPVYDNEGEKNSNLSDSSDFWFETNSNSDFEVDGISSRIKNKKKGIFDIFDTDDSDEDQYFLESCKYLRKSPETFLNNSLTNIKNNNSPFTNLEYKNFVNKNHFENLYDNENFGIQNMDHFSLYKDKNVYSYYNNNNSNFKITKLSIPSSKRPLGIANTKTEIKQLNNRNYFFNNANRMFNENLYLNSYNNKNVFYNFLFNKGKNNNKNYSVTSLTRPLCFSMNR